MSTVSPRTPPQRPVPAVWPVAGAPITLTLTANAGLLIAWQGYKLLVDALHGGDGQFSAVPPALLDQITAGEPPFDGVGWLFFTHLHRDHFSAQAVLRYLEGFPATPVFLPEWEGCAELAALRSGLAGREPLRMLNPRERVITFALAPGLKASVFPARHDGAEYGGVPHCCLLLSLGERSLLFLADAAQDPVYFSRLLEDASIDTVVTNPLFLSRSAGRETLLALRPGKIVVNHIPFAWEDSMRFREMVVRAVTRWAHLLPPMAVLWDPLDALQV